jgi:hypothetical protein
MLQNQIAQQSSFSRSSLSDDVEMLAFVHGSNTKGLGIAPALFLANDGVG